MKTRYDALEARANNAQQATTGQWSSENSEVYDEGCDSHPIASCECNTTCRQDYEQDEIASYIAHAHPAAIIGLIADVRALAEALQGLDDAYCRAGADLDRDERTEDRKRLIAARAALSRIQEAK